VRTASTSGYWTNTATWSNSTVPSNGDAVAIGSGGGANASRGGGLVRVDARGDVTVDGTISANGGNGDAGNTSGGSGGAVFISTGEFMTFWGAGELRARGGHDDLDPLEAR
jgi:hypothetical protein